MSKGTLVVMKPQIIITFMASLSSLFLASKLCRLIHTRSFHLPFTGAVDLCGKAKSNKQTSWLARQQTARRQSEQLAGRNFGAFSS